MDKFDRHIGSGKCIKIGEDDFIIKPLGMKHMKSFFKLMKKFDGAKGNSDFVKALDEDTTEVIEKLLMATLKKSYPEVDEEKLSEFGMKNFGELLPAIFEVNMGGVAENEAIKRAKKMTEDVQGKTQ